MLIKCSECGKEVSDKAASCPSCGNPITGSGSKHNAGNSEERNVAFENRIEEYKANRYTLLSRSGDTVKMRKHKFMAIAIACLLFVSFMYVSFSPLIFKGSIYERLIMFLFISVLPCVVFIVWYRITTKVTISLTKTGKVEETGKVLKSDT
jgi:hypothetical protein